ncbi:glycoside hydrolase family protein [Stappia indica]|uniref:glycoside hydrolase family protein n=1 Tax=Stappia indica TaxID=538381 RepID=UPI001CD363E5|nr:glycoside hydrolase family protein [Stappia indica]MCA1298046.1 glycoside hydrolase family protein [Stappia indica]
MKISKRGLAFIAGHEGFVSKAYRDSVGVLTIGYGFTMRSRIFAAYWRAKRGRALQLGDRISRDDADTVLAKLVDEEYGVAVTAYFGDLPQHQFDAACSVAFNLGPGAVKWRWGRALKAGDVDGAAMILAANYNTAGGRRLAGLVRRRKEEASLLANGNYGHGSAPAPDAQHDGDLLRQLGYDTDKWPVAVRSFQRDNGLVVDGIFGPASRATAKRLLTVKATRKDIGGAGVAAFIAAIAGYVSDLPTAQVLLFVGGIAVSVLAVWWIRGFIATRKPKGD